MTTRKKYSKESKEEDTVSLVTEQGYTRTEIVCIHSWTIAALIILKNNL